MYKFELSREDIEVDPYMANNHHICYTDEPIALALIILSIPEDNRWEYLVTVWFTGVDGGWHEDNWQIENNSQRADEWLEDAQALHDLDLDKILCVGKKVYIPPQFKIRKSQSRYCLIEKIYPEDGRQYAVLCGITSRGVSKSDSQVLYWPLNRINQLEVIKKQCTSQKANT